MSSGNAGGKIRVVLDSNVLISGLNFRGREHEVLALGADHKIDVLLSSGILNEVSQTLQRKFGYSALAAQGEIDGLLQWANIVVPTVAVQGVCRDADDDRILECSLEANADYLVTGDRDLLDLEDFRGTQIVNAAAFLEIYNEAFPA